MRYKQHIQGIKNNKETTGFSRHALNTGHQYVKIKETMTILKTTEKGPYMNSLENYYVQKATSQNLQLNDM
jgi:hypothetical protein